MTLSHPRLYFTESDLPVLRHRRGQGLHADIRRNLELSAEWCLEQTPRSVWIAPVSPDPIHENLYDRFYAIMGDLAITEHLAFAYAISGEVRYGRAARDWVLASCRVWQREGEGEVDGGKAYAVSRLLKGVAVGYDMVFDLLSPDEKTEIRETLTHIGHRYFTGYFTTSGKAGSDFHTHHATVEFASLGVAALALLDETPEAADWLEATVRKFEQHLLPYGLARDGAHIEGATFWASTMQYRLFFMDALRRVTGQDLFGPFEASMNADPALAGIAALHTSEYCDSHESFVLQPSYGQLDYCAPVLLGLAKVYRRPIYQCLALWDRTLGHIQKSRYVTPNGEQLLFELGGYAYIWYDPEVSNEPDEARLSWHFPSVNEAYMRTSWDPGDLLAGVRRHTVVVHAGSQAVLVGTAFPEDERDEATPLQISDTDDSTIIHSAGADGGVLDVELQRPNRCLIRRASSAPWQWISHGHPDHLRNTLIWPNGVVLQVVTGTLTEWKPDSMQDGLIVGNGLLHLRDASSRTSSCVTVQPSETGEIVIDIRT